MLLTILIVIFTLVALLALHEFGHFIIAKKLGVKVEEFGVGYPPRIVGKKFGETIYSINLLPFGAFVRITGEETREEGKDSFSQRPVWQRILIVLGGVVSFWIIAFLIFTFVMGVWGLPEVVNDDFPGEAEVRIISVSASSPAGIAGIKSGDTVLKIEGTGAEILEIKRVDKLQNFINSQVGKEVTLTLKRGEEIFEVSLVPRVSPPENEGPIGVGLVRVAYVKYPWYQIPGKGAVVTFQKTVQLPMALFSLFKGFLEGKEIEGVQLVGPIGIGGLMADFLKLGVDNFLLFVAMISVWLALFNILPIPALDGGKLLFLLIEGFRGKPVPQGIEQKVTTFFFFLLLILMVFVTIRDIIRLFHF